MFAILKSKYIRCLIGIFVFIFVSFVTYSSYASVCFLPTGDCGGDDVSADTNEDLIEWPDECIGADCDEPCTGNNCNNSDDADDTEPTCPNPCTEEEGHRTCRTDSNGCSIVEQECSGNTYLTQAYCASANSGKTCIQSGGCWIVESFGGDGGDGDGDNSDENDDTGEDTDECRTDEICFKPSFTCNGQKCTDKEVQQIIDYALEAATSIYENYGEQYDSSLTCMSSDWVTGENDIVYIDSAEVFNNPPILKVKKENIEDISFEFWDVDGEWYDDENPWYSDYVMFELYNEEGNVVVYLDDEEYVTFSGVNNNIIEYTIDFSRCPEDKICINVYPYTPNSSWDKYIYTDDTTLDIYVNNYSIHESYKGENIKMNKSYIVDNMNIYFDKENWKMGNGENNIEISYSLEGDVVIRGCNNCASINHNNVSISPKFVPIEGDLIGSFEPFIGVQSCKYAVTSSAWWNSHYAYSVGIYNRANDKTLDEIIWQARASSVRLPSFTINAMGSDGDRGTRYFDIPVTSSGYCYNLYRYGSNLNQASRCTDGALPYYTRSKSGYSVNDESISTLHGWNFTQYDCAGWYFNNMMFENFMEKMPYHSLEFQGIKNVSWSKNSIQLEVDGNSEWFCYKKESGSGSSCINLEKDHEAVHFSEEISITNTY